MCFWTSLAAAETGAEGWLRYAAISDRAVTARYRKLPDVVVSLDRSAIATAAQRELIRGIRGMLGRTLREQATSLDNEGEFLLGTEDEITRAYPFLAQSLPPLKKEAYSLTTTFLHGRQNIVVAGGDARGILYGVFALLEKIGCFESVVNLRQTRSPSAPIRWVNQWDNLDGTIERGYAGRSIFFDKGHVRPDLTRAADYARLLASIGLNGCTVNNVNADTRILDDEMLNEIATIAEAFRPWGVRLSLAVDLSSPKLIGHLDTFDPLDPQVSEWWRRKVDAIYRRIPDFAGFVVKADSEGRAGPSQYGRTPAEAANSLARALAPHSGVVLYRGFVYNHHLDWRDPKADRARAGYDNFRQLDGKFDENVIVQIKHGPIDFQAREPVSPLIPALRHTNEAIELQTTQEYTGQQRHLVFLVPMWKEMLDFDTRVNGERVTVKEIVTGKTFGRQRGGFVSVVNVGLDANWLAHPLAMANLYGYGHLAWNPDESAQSIADKWTRLTFGNDTRVSKTVSGMLLRSWQTYENYTGPLGAGTLTDIISVHYGPGIESSERNGWGQWHRANHDGIGMDRTVATGTGYIGQYPPQVAKVYESLGSIPDELLLFMHHVSYTYRLHSGKTVIQHIYDSHYEGAQQAALFVADWRSLRSSIDEERYEKVLHLLEYQAGHAIVWRDAICDWFRKMSGIPDASGRVGHHSDRVEAENMQLTGYSPVNVHPWETSSGGRAIACEREEVCKASVKLDKPSGWYRLTVQYFDLNDGNASFRVNVNGQEIAAWTADAQFPSDKMNGHTSTRLTVGGVALRPGDTLTIAGHPNGGEPAAIDYIEITREHQ